MTETLLLVAFFVQLLLYVLVVTSSRIAKELQPPIRILLLGSMSTLLIQLLGFRLPQGSFDGISKAVSIVSTLVVVICNAHFLASLCSPKFLNSMQYWCLQAGLLLCLMMSPVLLEGATISPLLTQFLNFLCLSLMGAALLVVMTLLNRVESDQVLQFRALSARRIMLGALGITLLALFSIPIMPAAASATAAWSCCFATVSTGYVVIERRLYLYHVARQALANSPLKEISDESLSLAAATIDSLAGALASTSNYGGTLARERNELTVSRQLALTNASKAVPADTGEGKLLNLINGDSEGVLEWIVYQLLLADSETGKPIMLEQVRPHLEALSSLSMAHFGVEIIGNSMATMETIQRLREEGIESRIAVISGERGTGRHLYSKALHNLRGNNRISEIEIGENTRLIEVLKVLSDLPSDSANSRNTLIVNYRPEARVDLAELIEPMRVIQSRSADVIIIVEPASVESQRESLRLFPQAFRIHLPPLRERYEDMLLQALWYLDKEARNQGSPIKAIEASALRSGLASRWDLNSQEVMDSVKIALLMREHSEDSVLHHFVAPDLASGRPAGAEWLAMRRRFYDLYQECAGENSKMAERLGIDRDMVSRFAKRFTDMQDGNFELKAR